MKTFIAEFVDLLGNVVGEVEVCANDLKEARMLIQSYKSHNIKITARTKIRVLRNE